MDIKFIYFKGCPNAESARGLLEKMGVCFHSIEQTKLAEKDPFRRYTSPSILIDGRLVYGALTQGADGGCSVEKLTFQRLKALIRPRSRGEFF